MSKDEKKRTDRSKRCAVKGCNSKIGGDKRFYSFPKDKKSGGFSPICKLWNIFTRIKDFQPLRTQVMCELHFAPECFHNKKNALKSLSVPTIYYDNGQKIKVCYDLKNLEYFGEESYKMMKEIEETHDERHNQINKKNRLKEFKTFCRFCFTNRHCSPIENFKSYSIDFEEIKEFLGINLINKAIQEIICSPCFEKLIDFDMYRKRCRNAYNNFMDQIKNVDNQLSDEIPFYPDESNIFDVKQEPIEIDNDPLDTNCDNKNEFDFENQSQISDQCDKEGFHYETSSNNEIRFQNESFILTDSLQNPYEVNIKIEHGSLNSQDLYDEEMMDEIPLINFFKNPKSKPSNIDSKFKSVKKVSTKKSIEQNKSKIIESDYEKNPQISKTRKEKHDLKTLSKKKSYECFFCRLKFYGLKIFDTHKCDVKKVKCEVTGCEDFFVSQAGYNQHIFHRHGLPKVGKKFCPACNTCYQMNAIMFDRHCRQCSKENEFEDKEIKCPQCPMVCDNIRIYAAHRMIHETKNLKKSVINEKGVRTVPKKPKSRDEICDLCGKNFDGPGLQKHKENVHLVGFDGKMFYCDQCPIAKPTKRLLQNHVRRTHVIKWHPCEICGKMFKNRDSWRMHQLVHNKHVKNENRCDLCPNSSGFLTKTELKKHMANLHGGEQPVRKFICDICQAAYSRDDQLIRHRSSVHHINKNLYTEEIIKQYIKD